MLDKIFGGALAFTLLFSGTAAIVSAAFEPAPATAIAAKAQGISMTVAQGATATPATASLQ